MLSPSFFNRWLLLSVKSFSLKFPKCIQHRLTHFLKNCANSANSSVALLASTCTNPEDLRKYFTKSFSSHTRNKVNLDFILSSPKFWLYMKVTAIVPYRDLTLREYGSWLSSFSKPVSMSDVGAWIQRTAGSQERKTDGRWEEEE